MKLTEQLKEKQKELQKRISFLLDEFHLENGECEVEIATEYFYTERLDGSKILTGRGVNINIEI